MFDALQFCTKGVCYSYVGISFISSRNSLFSAFSASTWAWGPPQLFLENVDGVSPHFELASKKVEGFLLLPKISHPPSFNSYKSVWFQEYILKFSYVLILYEHANFKLLDAFGPFLRLDPALGHIIIKKILKVQSSKWWYAHSLYRQKIVFSFLLLFLEIPYVTKKDMCEWNLKRPKKQCWIHNKYCILEFLL